MKCALFWSGGKDSLLALDRALRAGLDVTHLVTIYEGNTDRVRFHGVRRSLLQAQARGLGKTLIAEATHPRSAACSGRGSQASVSATYTCRKSAPGTNAVRPRTDFATSSPCGGLRRAC